MAYYLFLVHASVSPEQTSGLCSSIVRLLSSGLLSCHAHMHQYVLLLHASISLSDDLACAKLLYVLLKTLCQQRLWLSCQVDMHFGTVGHVDQVGHVKSSHWGMHKLSMCGPTSCHVMPSQTFSLF